MGSKNYVCVTCGQDFSRKYSAYRHNHHLHQEGGKIVRTLEYIIGRTTGEYSAADPVLFRRKRGEQTPDSRISFPFANVAHNSEYSRQSDTTQHKSYESNRDLYSEPARKNETQFNSNSSKREQIKSVYKRVFPNAGDTLLKRVEFAIEQVENPSLLNDYLQNLYAVDTFFKGSEKPVKEEVPLWQHPYLNDLPEVARAKLAAIERTMYRLNKNPLFIFEVIKWLGNAFRNTGDLGILTSNLDHLQRHGNME